MFSREKPPSIDTDPELNREEDSEQVGIEADVLNSRKPQQFGINNVLLHIFDEYNYTHETIIIP